MILKDVSDHSMTQAIEDNLFEFWASLEKSPSVKVDRTAEMIRFITGAPVSILNGVMRARFRSGDADKKVREALGPFRERKLPMWWWTGPSDTPGDLPRHLVAAGLAEGGEFPGMAVDLRNLNEAFDTPPGLTVQKLGSRDDLSEYNRVLAAGYGMPQFVVEEMMKHMMAAGSWPHGPWMAYLASVDGRPAATSLVFFAAGVAGLYYVATLQDARRRGAGTAVTLAPLREARDMGYRIAILHSSSMGYGIYRRLGFRDYCRIGRYVWTPDA